MQKKLPSGHVAALADAKLAMTVLRRLRRARKDPFSEAPTNPHVLRDVNKQLKQLRNSASTVDRLLVGGHVDELAISDDDPMHGGGYQSASGEAKLKRVGHADLPENSRRCQRAILRSNTIRMRAKVFEESGYFGTYHHHLGPNLQTVIDDLVEIGGTQFGASVVSQTPFTPAAKATAVDQRRDVFQTYHGFVTADVGMSLVAGFRYWWLLEEEPGAPLEGMDEARQSELVDELLSGLFGPKEGILNMDMVGTSQFVASRAILERVAALRSSVSTLASSVAEPSLLVGLGALSCAAGTQSRGKMARLVDAWGSAAIQPLAKSIAATSESVEVESAEEDSAAKMKSNTAVLAVHSLALTWLLVRRHMAALSDLWVVNPLAFAFAAHRWMAPASLEVAVPSRDGQDQLPEQAMLHTILGTMSAAVVACSAEHLNAANAYSVEHRRAHLRASARHYVSIVSHPTAGKATRSSKVDVPEDVSVEDRLASLLATLRACRVVAETLHHNGPLLRGVMEGKSPEAVVKRVADAALQRVLLTIAGVSNGRHVLSVSMRRGFEECLGSAALLGVMKSSNILGATKSVLKTLSQLDDRQN